MISIPVYMIIMICQEKILKYLNILKKSWEIIKNGNYLHHKRLIKSLVKIINNSKNNKWINKYKMSWMNKAIKF